MDLVLLLNVGAKLQTALIQSDLVFVHRAAASVFSFMTGIVLMHLRAQLLRSPESIQSSSTGRRGAL